MAKRLGHRGRWWGRDAAGVCQARGRRCCQRGGRRCAAALRLPASDFLIIRLLHDAHHSPRPWRGRRGARRGRAWRATRDSAALLRSAALKRAIERSARRAGATYAMANITRWLRGRKSAVISNEARAPPRVAHEARQLPALQHARPCKRPFDDAHLLSFLRCPYAEIRCDTRWRYAMILALGAMMAQSRATCLCPSSD